MKTESFFSLLIEIQLLFSKEKEMEILGSMESLHLKVCSNEGRKSQLFKCSSLFWYIVYSVLCKLPESLFDWYLPLNYKIFAVEFLLPVDWQKDVTVFWVIVVLSFDTRINLVLFQFLAS